MQVIQTINDTIRVLFSPSEEDFKLLDFLLVQESGNKYLAQIIEIYDDKYDASQNVARVKLFFKVNENGEVFSYDHFTPSKECEINKLKKEEILTFINEGKEAINIGLDYKSEEPLDINLDFLKNNAVIFADKIDHSNNICAHLAHTMSRYNKHSVVFDYTGTLEIQNAKKLKVTKDIKLPLDFYSVEYIWEKGLSTASLETQAICREIFNEVKTFAKKAPEGFIPFNKFLNVVEIQYKATPITELTVLLNKLKAYQKNNIFAKSKKDFEIIEKTVNENDVTIIDFSELKTSWHKEFSEFIIRNLKEDIFVFLRLNETNTDIDLINFMYDKKPKVRFIPSISYSFSKMPHIVERAKNYILLPTLNPKRDFGAANFELMSIAKDECILFGEDTEEFIFTIKNNRFENSSHSEPRALKKTRLKIADLEIKTGNTLREKPSEEIQEQPEEAMPTEEELEFFAQFEEPVEEKGNTEEEKTPIKKPEEEDIPAYYDEPAQNPQQEESLIETKEEEAVSQAQAENNTEPIEQVEENLPEEETEQLPQETIEETVSEEIQQEPEVQKPQMPEGVIIEEADTEQELVLEEEIAEQTEPEEVYQQVENLETLPIIEEANETQEPALDTEEQNVIIEQNEKQPEENSDEQVPADNKFQNILEETQEDEPLQESQDDSLSLETLAQQSIEAAFSEVMDNEEEEKSDSKEQNDNSNSLVIDNNVVIDLEKIKDQIDTKNGSELPIFKNKTEVKEKEVFNTGDKIEHDKYGKGEVVKVITYANRSLLQINFEEVGKRLLDPDIANIKKADK